MRLQDPVVPLAKVVRNHTDGFSVTQVVKPTYLGPGKDSQSEPKGLSHTRMKQATPEARCASVVPTIVGFGDGKVFHGSSVAKKHLKKEYNILLI